MPKGSCGAARRQMRFALWCLALLAVVPHAAAAQSPTEAAYAESGAGVLPAPAAAPVARPGRGAVAGSSIESLVRARAGATAGVLGVGSEGAPAAAERLQGGALPFTGADTILAALAGLVLLSIGLVLRRSTRGPPN
jgi:LPXTG-motif cell wall-anchored protein